MSICFKFYVSNLGFKFRGGQWESTTLLSSKSNIFYFHVLVRKEWCLSKCLSVNTLANTLLVIQPNFEEIKE